MTKQRRPRTWLEVAVANGSIREAIRALNWAHSWIHVQVAYGLAPSVDEVAEWWNQPRRTAFREQAAFRKCFPYLDDPSPLYASKAQLDSVQRTVKIFDKLDAAKRARKRATDSDLLGTGLEPA